MRGDLWRRLGLPWLGREDVEVEIDDELAFHLEMRERELVEGGVDPEEARRRVREEFGDLDRTRRAYMRRRGRRLKRGRGRAWLAELVQDLRFGARGLRHRPVFTATAIVVLALGIGAPTTVFTLVETIFFERPAHVAQPHRLIRVFRSWEPGEGGTVTRGSSPDGSTWWAGSPTASRSRRPRRTSSPSPTPSSIHTKARWRACWSAGSSSIDRLRRPA